MTAAMSLAAGVPRASGILLHPTSLPDAADAPDRSTAAAGAAAAGAARLSVARPGSGDFGAAAYRFVDWLGQAGQRLWQMLPLVPTGSGNSPYMSPSAFALNPLLIDLQDLVGHGWLRVDRDGVPDGIGTEACRRGRPADARIDFESVTRFRLSCLRLAAGGFFAAGGQRDPAFQQFCAAEVDWLDDYALFMALGDHFPGPWCNWPLPLAGRDRAALADAHRQYAENVAFWRFVQWTAYRQWGALKQTANDRGIRIIGDLPIFVALHSADVWAHPELFDLDGSLRPRVVAGVPPDYFSATGQLWGNPLYRWERHAATGYRWWIQRVRHAITTADVVRIDHFRGFAGYWEIPADAETAVNGRWVAGPGNALFDALAAALVDLPIIAEDLGVVTPDVVALRESVGLPGMRVLQFAFSDDARNPYLPHRFTADTVVYTGTHDNDTSLGWFDQATQHERRHAQIYLKTDGREIHWDLIHAASQSVAATAIYPLQDVLGLGSDARMNRPGDPDGCWGWRFRWHQIEPWQTRRLREITAAHGR
ncbi:MAG: 4-alpha-glucanotransferase [Lautropia sp.]